MSQELLDKILQELAGGDYQEEVKRARDDYFGGIQDLREDDPSYERLTLCFLNWYLLDRPMDDGRGSPLQVYASRLAEDDELRALCARLAANLHSLFEVLRLEERAAVLRDLFSSEQVRVTERRQLAGLAKGDLLEARLFPLSDRLVFVNGAFVLHPRAAGPAIRQAVERSRVEGSPEPQALLRRLQALTFRYTDRYRERVPVEKVFSELENPTGGDQ